MRGSDDVFEGEIRKQVELAIDEADVIIFVVDVEKGITPMDDTCCKVTKPVLLVDNKGSEEDAIEFYNLGLGEHYTLPALDADAFPKPEPVQKLF
jgi:GTP-binding protein